MENQNKKFDFSGWATKANVKCSDGRIIGVNAFADDDGKTVPLVWNHQHNDPHNVLGHALLKNKSDGVYAYCYLNDTETGDTVRSLIKHGDIESLSIYANKLKSNGNTVIHGSIKELSVVLAGANPGASIDNIVIHGEDINEEAIIFNDEENVYLYHSEQDDIVEDQDSKKEEIIEHAEDNKMAKEEVVTKEVVKEEVKEPEAGKKTDKTVQDVIDSMTEEQKNVMYAMVGLALEEEKNDKETEMKHNVFENEKKETSMTQDEMNAIFADAKRYGTLKESFLQHSEEYGIESIDYLFPDAKMVPDSLEYIKRDDSWAKKVLDSVHRSPFSKVKSVFADITEDEARAKGYLKGARKRDEVFALLKRSTDPTTVYKKQKMDRDDLIDITEFDAVANIKTEMRWMLNEELARAMLLGDGRSAASPDKIDETKIRPVWTDDDLFTIKKTLNVSATPSENEIASTFIRTAIKARKQYKGSGNPVLFTTEDMLSNMLLLTDEVGRDLYDSIDKLKTKLRVADIITVPVMENQHREDHGVEKTLLGIFVNFRDYNVGADKGGAISMFDDFDIDYNQQKYLIETRCSGALVKPFSAIAIEIDSQYYLSRLTIAPVDGASELLGKAVSELQASVSINGSRIAGTLHYVTGYTGFSGKTEEQSGYYLALEADTNAESVITAELIGGSLGRPVTLDADKNIVFRISNVNQKIRFVATDDNDNRIEKVFNLRDLVLEEQE